MAGLRLTRTVLRDGVWHGEAAWEDGAETPAPTLRATHRGRDIPAPEVTHAAAAGRWDVRLALPADLIADEVQTVVISEAGADTPLAVIAIAAGAALDHDLSAEVALLRAELDLLKRAFRRHVGGRG